MEGKVRHAIRMILELVEKQGRWVTLPDGRRIFIGGEGTPQYDHDVTLGDGSKVAMRRAAPSRLVLNYFTDPAETHGKFGVGDIIHDASNSRYVLVDSKHDDVKRGQPGWGGRVVAVSGRNSEDIGREVWGYTSDISHVGRRKK